MANYVRFIRASGIHARFDIEQEFFPGVNILFGKNGTGKTTLLHIIANILNGDYQRFAYLTFNTINLQLDNGFDILLHRQMDQERPFISISINGRTKTNVYIDDVKKIERSASEATSRRTTSDPYKDAKTPLSADYFPAFRNMIEAWVSTRDERDLTRRIYSGSYDDPVGRRYIAEGRPLSATRLARDLFGPFVPRINYPSPIEIEERLRLEIQQALINVGNTDRKLLSQAFREIYSALSEEAHRIRTQPEIILEQIRTLSQRLKDSSLAVQTESMIVDEELRKLFYSAQFRRDSDNFAAPILEVYRKALEELVNVQELSFENINRYFDSVNDFLEQKRLVIHPRNSRGIDSIVSIIFDDGSFSDLRSLSSGERQIIALIYAATHMRSQEVVLIDEPEISLHIDWQRKLLKKMAEQLPDRQIIACTHSPVIGADYDERTIDLTFSPTKRFIQSALFEEHTDSEEEEF